MHGFPERTRHAGNTKRRTEAVIVLVVVPHDIHCICALHEVAQGMGHHARLHTRMLFDRLCLTAEELCLATYIERHLVAAAPKRKVELFLCLLAKFFQRLLCCNGKTDGERHGHPLCIDDLPHLVKDVKFFCNRMIQCSAVQQCHELTVRDAAHKATQSVHPRIEALAHREQQL